MRDTGFDVRLMAKQYVAELKGRWCWFRVLESGDPKFYLFCALDTWGCDNGVHFPVRKTDLKPEVRRALRAGWGHA